MTLAESQLALAALVTRSACFGGCSGRYGRRCCRASSPSVHSGCRNDYSRRGRYELRIGLVTVFPFPDVVHPGENAGDILAVAAPPMDELKNRQAAIRLGVWQPPAVPPAIEVQETPTLHTFASTWFADRRADGLKPRSLEALEWALSHVLEHLAAVPVNEITVDRADAYRRAKLRERELGVVERPLSNASINRTIAVLAAVCVTPLWKRGTCRRILPAASGAG
jgi:hypothetical protein